MNEKQLLEFRKEKDELFRSGNESPLTSEQKQNFSGLAFYPPNPKLIFHNLTIIPTGGEQIIQIQTSAGDMEPFKKLGKIHFKIEGVSCELTVFADFNSPGIFLPFKDETNGPETYHNGRYIEVEVVNGKIIELDFNYAYNPYCAYNDNFRCPLTPDENTLAVAITAGEKKFD